MFPVDVTSSRSRVSKDSYYPLPPPPRPPPPRSCYHSSLTSKALVLVSSGVFTSSTLSNIFPVDVASSRSRVSKDNYYPLPLSPPRSCYRSSPHLQRLGLGVLESLHQLHIVQHVPRRRGQLTQQGVLQVLQQLLVLTDREKCKYFFRVLLFVS